MSPDTDVQTPSEVQAPRRMPGTGILAVVALVASIAAVGVAVRANSQKGAVGGASSVGVVEKDFAIQAPVPSAKAGLIDFTVANAGPAAHEFLVFRADQAPDQLPLGADGRVDESNSAITKVFDSGDNINPGSSRTFHAALVPGTYVLVCNLPGHYKAGMHTRFTVQ